MMKLNDEYLELTAGLTQDVKTSSYSQLNMEPNSRHLEVGSGNGYDTLALAEQYPQSVIIGVDLNEEIVDVANRRAKEKELGNVVHFLGDAATISYTEKFNSMRAERVFQHLSDEQISGLVKHLAAYAESECVFSMVGIDWETLTCTVSKDTRRNFRTIKEFLVDNSNNTSIHTAIDVFESHGFRTGEIDIFSITTSNFNVAMTAFNLDNIASQVDIDADGFQRLKDSFIDDKHYFSVSGCAAPFIAAKS